MGVRVLLTGGAGYLGSVMTSHLLDAGHTVTVLDNLMYGQQSLFHVCAHPGFAFERGDVRDEQLLKRLVPKHDVLIPLAAIVGAPACDRDPLLATTVNRDSIVLLNRLRSRQQLVIYPVTNSGYGAKTGEQMCTEETQLEPISLYGTTKVEAERHLLDTPNTITLRLATVFGISPRLRLDLLVNHFVYAAVTDRYLVLFEKHFQRNFVHIRDVADCFVHCIANAATMCGRPYNVGLDAANMTKEELALCIQKHLPEFVVHTSEIGKDPDKRNYIVSSARLHATGFVPRRGLDDGIKELIQGFRMLPRGRYANV